MPPSLRMMLSLVAVAVLAACGAGASKPDEAAAANTIACNASGERIVIRFETDEVRLLLTGGERVTLYKVPAGAGVRYTNGRMDLVTRGEVMRFARDGGALEELQGCGPLVPPRP